MSRNPPQLAPSERIRRLWPLFKQSVAKSRNLLEHKVEALLDKAEKEHEKTSPDRRRPTDQHVAHKAALAKQIRQPHFKSLRRQWELKLQEVGLRMEDWTDISNEEIASVIQVLGNPEDEPEEPAVVPDHPTSQPPLPPKQTFSSASLATYATSLPQPLAPSLSSSTRSTNVSTNSSYAFVDPSEFHSEEEEDSGFFFPVATSYDLTSDDEDRPRQPKQNGFDAWSSDSSSHHSHDGPSTSRLPSSSLPPNPRKMTSAGKQAASLKVKEEVLVPRGRQSYVGPIVSDPDEPLSEEQEFERFKMNVRFQKIVEFHQAAAHADIELAIAIYKDRMAQNSDKHEVSSKVTNHQKRMMQLQMEKEEERKNIVKAERSKRRSELRRRPGRSGTLVAPRPSVPANPSWLNAFQEQVAEEVETNIVLDKILSSDPDEQEGNVEKLLERLLPGSSSSLNEDHRQNFIPRDGYSSTGPNGWGIPSTSFLRPADVNHEASPITPKRHSNGRFTKHNNMRLAKPSLFGEDPESSDEEEEEDSPSPPVSVNPPQPPQHSHPFMSEGADSMLTNHLLADPELYSYINQWGTTGELPSVPSPTTATPWGMNQFAQTPTMDNPDPWKLMKDDVRSTPVATRRKSSFSASLNHTTPTTQNPYSAFMAEQPSGMGMSLATLAVLNSANAREKQPVPELVKKISPPQSTPASAASSSSTPAQPSPPVVTPQAKTDPTPNQPVTGKKPGKKQRQAMKKAGAGSSTNIEDSSQILELPDPPPTETTPMATIFEKTPLPGTANPETNFNGAGIGRGRKDSTSGWGELLSTPRPASNIPAHLLEKANGGGLPKQESMLQKPGEQFRLASGSGLGSGMSTIKAAPQRGSGLKNATTAAARTAWSIFSSGDAGPGPGESQTEGRETWVPGGFEVDDGGGGGGGHEDQSFAAQFLGAAPSALHKTTPASRSNGISPPNFSSSKPVPGSSVSSSQPQPQPQPHPPSLSPTNKKGKNRKAKGGKKVTVEEVPDEEEEIRGERLPVDYRYIMESRNSTILEPRPSVPSRMFDSIIGFGDEEGGEDGGGDSSSSFISAPDTAPGLSSSSSASPPEPFDGDPARFAAAMQEIQEANARMEKKFTTTPVWGANTTTNSSNNNTNKTKPNVREPESLSSNNATPIFSWGQPMTRKGPGSVLGDNNVNIPKPPPIVQNLKRSKVAASGGKLL